MYKSKTIKRKGIKAIITDLDNTLYDWVGFVVPALQSMTDFLAYKTGIDKRRIIDSMRAIYERERTLEYAFVIQEADVFADYLDNFDAFRRDIIEPAQRYFDRKRRLYLRLFPGVRVAIQKLRDMGIKIIGLSDAPGFPARQRLRFLKIDKYFNAIYTLKSYDIPKFVDEKILKKHHMGKYDIKCSNIVELPLEYEKPSTKGVEKILNDFGLKPSQTLIIGDNKKKDIGIANALGIKGIWAKYGTNIPNHKLKMLSIYSPKSITKRNVADKDIVENITPFATIKRFSDILEFI